MNFPICKAKIGKDILKEIKPNSRLFSCSGESIFTCKYQRSDKQKWF